MRGTIAEAVENATDGRAIGRTGESSQSISPGKETILCGVPTSWYLGNLQINSTRKTPTTQRKSKVSPCQQGEGHSSTN